MRRIPQGVGLLIGIPTLGRLQPLQWGLAFKSLSPPINYNSNTMIIYGCPVDEARNKIAEQAIAIDAKFLFFLGDDVVVPPQTLKQLIYRLEQHPEAGVVGGVYCSKCIPSAPLVFKELGQGSYWDWKIGEFFEVCGLGMDCTLIRTEVLKKLSKPWFKTVREDNFADGINHADEWTEDLYFLKKVHEETEYKIFCDGSIICDHYDGNTAYKLPADSLPTRQLAVQKSKRALDIGCGEVNRTEQFPEHELVRVDIREEAKPDYRCDVRDLPFGTDEYDLVFSSHVLEHFLREETEPLLREWLRVLKPGGDFILVVPNVKWVLDGLKDGEVVKLNNDQMNVLYGAQSNEFDIHKTGFTPGDMQELLKGFGITEVTFEYVGFNLISKFRKP